MSYTKIKWIILFLPTVTIGLWEYIRHQFLMPYLSMEVGNWLSPVIIYVVSVTLLRQLFDMLENTRAALDQERIVKGKLEERQLLAGELHDGVAQSLFLLGVKLDRAKRMYDDPQVQETLNDISRTVSEANHDVRQAIADLKHVPRSGETEEVSLAYRVWEMIPLAGVQTQLDWKLDDQYIQPEEQAELLACIREGLLNIHKHARASQVWIHSEGNPSGWQIVIEDDGEGFHEQSLQLPGRFGLKITAERAQWRGWTFALQREQERTLFIIKGGQHDE